MFGYIIHVRCLAEGYQKAVETVWKFGKEVETEWGEKAKEVICLVVHVKNPLQEPRIHKGDLISVMHAKKYVKELLEGTLDFAIGKYIDYTYHERIFNYVVPQYIEHDVEELKRTFNQIDYIINKLKKTPFSRRAIAVTWQVWKDTKSNNPPCLICLWFKVIDNKLTMIAQFRSRDVFRAWGCNAYGLTELQKYVADKLGVKVGEYIDISFSAHIYESCYKDVQRFLEICKKRKLFQGVSPC